MPKLGEDQLAAARNALIRMHEAAGIGHLGGNLSSLDAMMLVHHEFLSENDRFVLSKGHSVGALYVTLASLGQLPDGALRTFHGDGTSLPGHPPAVGTPQIPFATGSLGHGLSLAAGLALARRFGAPINHVWCLTSDGEWQEGSTWEGLIFACHHRLSNLTVLVDHNGLQGFGTLAAVASMCNLDERIAAHGAAVHLCDGHDLCSMRDAISQVVLGRGPHVVVLRTIKGFGWSRLAGTIDSHYRPPTAEDVINFEQTQSGRAQESHA